MAAEKVMSDDDGLPNTLTPKEGTFQETPSIASKMPWGRFITCQTFLKSVGKWYISFHWFLCCIILLPIQSSCRLRNKFVDVDYSKF